MPEVRPQNESSLQGSKLFLDPFQLNRQKLISLPFCPVTLPYAHINAQG